ncbi:MAG: hypothetical protein IJV03_00060 [Alphaproteobacteria bacterium]|jgi:hypothetical protein|nr:hypothetical protein [Alphaproteobacteria bacterium]
MANTTNTFKKSAENLKKTTENLNTAKKAENFKNARIDITKKFASLGIDVNMLNTQNVKTAA